MIRNCTNKVEASQGINTLVFWPVVDLSLFPKGSGRGPNKGSKFNKEIHLIFFWRNEKL